MTQALVQNFGRSINFVNGITGVSPGGNAIVNLQTNLRYHRITFQCACVNYTGGIALPTVAITGVGVGLTVTPTIASGVVTAVAVVAGGAAYVTGDRITITDATGIGFVGTVTAAAGVVSAVAITSIGSASPASPVMFFNSIQQIVNGIAVRDITPDMILRTSMAGGYYPSLGELPLLYTTPERNFVQRNDVTSWDLFGQSTFTIKFQIASGVQLPSLSGVVEFDYERNTKLSADGKTEVPYLEPVAQHQFSWPIVAGRNDITTLPYDFPITRLWFLGSVPGSISQVEVYQDGNKVFEATDAQLEQIYQEYGFTFGRPDFLNVNYAGSNALKAAFNAPAYFDNAYIADADGRWSKRLSVANNLTVRVYSTVAQTLTIVQETMPGNYA